MYRRVSGFGLTEVSVFVVGKREILTKKGLRTLSDFDTYV